MKKFILFFIAIFCIGSFIPTQAYTHIDQYYKQCNTGYKYNTCNRKTCKPKNRYATRKNKQMQETAKKVNNKKTKTSVYKHKKCKFGRCYAKVK